MTRVATTASQRSDLTDEWRRDLEQLPVILTYGHLSELLGRSVGALRHAVCAPKTSADELLRRARVPVGRRTYFKRSMVARMLAEAEAAASRDGG